MSRVRVMALLLAAVVVPPSVADAAVEWIERPDDMHGVFFEDYDRHADRIRLLYQTLPSLDQIAGSWAHNVYVVEIDGAGNIEQRLLRSDQANYAALALRRGHDEVVALIRSADTGELARLERWSSADGIVLSSAPPPAVLQAQAGTSGRVPLVPTEDGNVFMTAGGGAASSAPNAPARPIEWYKLTADGDLERGEYAHGADWVAVDGAFGAANDAVGLFVLISVPRGASGIETDIPTPIRRSIGARTLEATVGNELRVLVDGGAGTILSPALERSLIWSGELQLPQNLPIAELMEQNIAQQRLIGETELEYAASRTLVRSQIGPWAWPIIKRSSDGYVLLATVTTDRDRDPPAAGPYLLEVGTDGTLSRELYLGPVAEAIDGDFSNFLPTEDDATLLAGTRRVDNRVVGHVTRVDARGQGEWTAELDAPAGSFAGIAQNQAGVWVFSHGLDSERDKTLFWVERVDESRRSTVSVPPIQSRTDTSATQSPTAAPVSAAIPVPTVEPIPTNGCSCTCEEFAEIQRLSDQFERAQSPGQAPVLPDPATVSKLMCAASCGLSYATCSAR